MVLMLSEDVSKIGELPEPDGNSRGSYFIL
jgi:hypothetical protein